MEVVAHENPGDRHAGKRIDHNDDDSAQQGELESSPRLGVSDRRPERAPSAVEGLRRHRRYRDEDEKLR